MQQNSGKSCHVCHNICVWWSALGWQEHVWHQGVWLQLCAPHQLDVISGCVPNCHLWKAVRCTKIKLYIRYPNSVGRCACTRAMKVRRMSVSSPSPSSKGVGCGRCRFACERGWRAAACVVFWGYNADMRLPQFVPLEKRLRSVFHPEGAMVHRRKPRKLPVMLRRFWNKWVG
eukprot:1195499-Prorocentrum_minimum.AAC.1